MTAALVLIAIILIRTLVPLGILRWPFWAALACILADASDSILQDAFSAHSLDGVYHNVDKAFDIYYLAIEAFAVRRWAEPMVRNTAWALFALRMAAVAVFEVTDVRQVFFFGPNVFENFYLFIAGMRTIDPAHRVGSGRQLALIVAAVAAPKLLQEYVMHFREYQTWHFVKHNILFWPG
ncbi:MAG: hypothetical protein IT303_14505 [Dehalococcoidia bacterium]|nr:hypothetical protein [Dehalococcoidia bacterium]